MKYAYTSKLVFTPLTCSIVVVYKKRKPSSKSAARGDDTDTNVSYQAKSQSVNVTGKPHSQATSSSHRDYIQPPTPATVNSAYGVVQKESKQLDDDTYDTVEVGAKE